MTGLFGGAFDPPHNGHVALVAGAADHFDFDQIVILVSERPAHRSVTAPADVRVRLAEAAFPDCEVELDPYPRTIDLLRARDFGEAVLLIGADQYRDFATWKEPEAVLERVRLGVATRPGHPVTATSDDRISYFEIEPVPVSGTMVRSRAARGEPLDGLVPPGVARLIEELGLYRGGVH